MHPSLTHLSEIRTVVTDDPNPWLLIVAAAVVVVLLLVLLWPRVRGNGRRAGEHAPRASDPTLSQQRAVERDMQTLMRELSEMARKIGAQLDAKSARLEELIRAADERAERLELSERGDRTERGSSPVDIESNGPLIDPPPSIVLAPQSRAETDPRHAQVYSLLDQGLSSYQIAERLGRPEGEVELIIALRPRGREAV